MKLKMGIVLPIIVVSLMASLATCNNEEDNYDGSGECDLEGSTCDSEAHCCNPALCKESKKDTTCCNATTLANFPIPDNCSKCKACGEGDSTGAIIGISVAVGVAVVLAVVTILVAKWKELCCFKKKSGFQAVKDQIT